MPSNLNNRQKMPNFFNNIRRKIIYLTLSIMKKTLLNLINNREMFLMSLIMNKQTKLLE